MEAKIRSSRSQMMRDNISDNHLFHCRCGVPEFLNVSRACFTETTNTLTKKMKIHNVESVRSYCKHVMTQTTCHRSSLVQGFVAGSSHFVLLCGVCVSRMRLPRSSFVVQCCFLAAQFCRHFFKSAGAHDHTKGDVFQTQTREVFMTGQVRKDELSSMA